MYYFSLKVKYNATSLYMLFKENWQLYQPITLAASYYSVFNNFVVNISFYSSEGKKIY